MSNVSSTIQAGSSGTFSFGYEAGTGSYAGSISATSVPSGWTVTSPAFGATTFTPTLSSDTATVNVPAGTPAGTYTVSIYGAFAAPYDTGYGAPGTITDTVTVTAVLLTPLQQWEVSYGNAQNALIAPDVAAVQTDINTDEANSTAWPSTPAQLADNNKLYADVHLIAIGTFPFPPITASPNYWSSAISELLGVSEPGGDSGNTVAASQDLFWAKWDINESGVEY